MGLAEFFAAKNTKSKKSANGKPSTSDENDSDRNVDESGSVGNRSRHDSTSTDEESTTEDIEFRFRPPAHKWSVCRSFRNREYGLKAQEGPSWFRYRTMGSLHMVQRLELMDKLEGHEGCVNCLNFNASGTRLASGSDDTNVTIWDWATGDPVLTFDTKHRSNVFQAKFMPLSGDCHIVTCARDGQVRLAELSVRGVCKETRKLATHRGAAHKLSVEVDSPHVFLTCGEDAVVMQIDLRDPKPNKLFVTRHKDEKVPLYSVHSNPRNPLEFATSGRDEYCRIYDKRKIETDGGTPVKKYCPHRLIDSEMKPNVTCLMYNFDGSELLASYNDEDIYSFDTRHSDGAEYIRRFTGHRNSATVKGVNWYGGCSEFVVSGSDCGNVFIWEKESEKIVHWMPADEGGVVNCLEPHPTMPVLATSGLDHDVKIWVPSCEDPQFSTEKLRKLVKDNQKQRREENSRGNSDIMDAQFIHFVMQHIRRMRDRQGRQRRREGQAEGEEALNESSDEDTEEEDDSDDEESSRAALPQCRTS